MRCEAASGGQAPYGTVPTEGTHTHDHDRRRTDFGCRTAIRYRPFGIADARGGALTGGAATRAHRGTGVPARRTAPRSARRATAPAAGAARRAAPDDHPHS